MIRVTVPATSANLGSAFDCAGLALGLYNSVEMEPSDALEIRTLDGTVVPFDESNMLYMAAMRLCEELGRPPMPLAIRQTNDIPMAHGLGSSAACVVAGLCGMNALLGEPLTRDELLSLAVSMDGHPDNVAPAMLGGVVIAAMGEQKLAYSRIELKDDIEFAAFIPPFPLATDYARKALPAEVPFKDAVFNLSRSAVLAAAFATSDYALLREACRDRLHQPYRIGLIDGADEVLQIADECGALASFISGAGSTLLAIVGADNRDFWANAKQKLTQGEKTAVYELKRLPADNVGVVVESL